MRPPAQLFVQEAEVTAGSESVFSPWPRSLGTSPCLFARPAAGPPGGEGGSSPDYLLPQEKWGSPLCSGFPPHVKAQTSQPPAQVVAFSESPEAGHVWLAPGRASLSQSAPSSALPAPPRVLSYAKSWPDGSFLSPSKKPGTSRHLSDLSLASFFSCRTPAPAPCLPVAGGGGPWAQLTCPYPRGSSSRAGAGSASFPVVCEQGHEAISGVGLSPCVSKGRPRCPTVRGRVRSWKPEARAHRLPPPPPRPSQK